MYKYKSGQISITDFGQPMGMHLNENNRWVKKAAMIPWNEIEKRYAGLFKSHKGHPAKPLRLALGACMIQNTVIPMRKSHYRYRRTPIFNTSAVMKLMTTANRRLIHRAWCISVND